MKYFIGILFIFSCTGIHAQSANKSEILIFKSEITSNSYYQDLWKQHFENKLPGQKLGFQQPSSMFFLGTPNCLPGLFCKMEYKIETKSKLSPRFRLGSLNYTEWMEGKRDYYSRYFP
ncbi:MAG: hypothetical protein ABIQ02_03140 [Saprospiraceae bacterium]